MKNAVRCGNNGKEYNDDEATDSSNFPSGCSSPLNDSQDGDNYFDFTKSDLYTATHKNATKLVQDTLFDEGLRIAQQYGMADFAEQLMELQQQKPKSTTMNNVKATKPFEKKVNGNCGHKSNGNDTEEDEVTPEDDEENVVVDEDNNDNNNNTSCINSTIATNNNSRNSSRSNSRCPSHSGSGGEDSPCKPPVPLLTKNNGVVDTETNENGASDSVIRAGCHMRHERSDEEEKEAVGYYDEGKKMLMGADTVASEMLLRDARLKESSNNYLGGAMEHNIFQNGECAN